MSDVQEAGFRLRLRECRYTSPSGQVFSPSFDDVSRTNGKKAQVSELPLQDLAAVQDLGQRAIRFPLAVYFHGPDYDQVADRFFTALNEPGIGLLEHPRYGDVSVLPVTVTQSESFVRGSARATFEIDFVESLDEQFEYPERVGLSIDAISSTVDTASLDIVSSLDKSPPPTVTERAALRDLTIGNTQKAAASLNRISGIANETRASITDTAAEITANVDAIVGAPANLASSALTLYRLPARTLTTVQAKISGYRDLYTGLKDGWIETTRRYGGLIGLVNTAQAGGLVAASAESTGSGEFETRSEAQNVASDLSGLLADYDDLVDIAGSDYERDRAVRDTVTVALTGVIERALSLPLERSVTLEYDEDLITLADRLFSPGFDIEQALDRLISYNSLGGDELLIVKAGRTVRWYE